ncbi:MAG: hypothetical protein WBG29_18265, partial [Candidatus Acidiferrales bacterium]
LDGGPNEILVGRQKVKACHFGVKDHSVRSFTQDNGVVDCASRRIFRKSKPAGRIALRVAINDECTPAFHSQRGTKIYSCGGLTDAALLIGNGYYPSQSAPLTIFVELSKR